MSAAKYDVIVVGAGHNGLVTAASLARAGRKVLVLERADAPGGQLAGGRLWPGVEAPALHPSGRLRPDIVRDLDLARHGLPVAPQTSNAAYVSLLPGGETLRLTADAGDKATIESIRRLSTRDAERWPEFVAFMNAAADFLERRAPRVEGEEQLREIVLRQRELVEEASARVHVVRRPRLEVRVADSRVLRERAARSTARRTWPRPWERLRRLDRLGEGLALAKTTDELRGVDARDERPRPHRARLAAVREEGGLPDHDGSSPRA
jgi:monoamine oxidase